MGGQLKVLEYLLSKIDDQVQNITFPIIIKDISKEIGIKEDNVRTYLKRLKKNGVISLFFSRRGEGGWSKFQVSKEIK
jgi:DNA-binding transcriptional regulator PaaX